MKKFFTLVCAIAIAFCASAAPFAPKAELAKKAPVAVEQMQKVQMVAQFEQAPVMNLNQLSATPALKVSNLTAPAKIEPKDLATQGRSVAPKKAVNDYSNTFDYKCGPTEVVVTDLSTPTYNEFKLVITQKAKNTTEYSKETLYDTSVELILDPDEHSIVGTFTSDDYTIGSNTFVKYSTNTRYVSAWESSTITIVSKGGNKYAITDGLLQVENSTGTNLYKYNYCYDVANLSDPTAEKVAFEFTFGEEPTPPVTFDTIQVTATQYSAKYYASSEDWQVIMYDAAGNGYSFDILAPAEGIENGKTYTSENSDFDLEYTYAVINKAKDAAVAASYTQTETEDALSVTAEMTTAGNHVYQFTYELDKTVEVKDANGIIIQPAKGEIKEYNRLATNTCFYLNSSTGQTSLAYQSGTATLVECADGTVYWKDPVSKYAPGTWIKGTKEGSTITFATKQPVSYNSNYKATLSVRWGLYDPQTGFKVADDYADSFILDIKGDSLIMRGTQATTGATAAYFPGIFWDDDNTFQSYGDCGVNLYIPGWTPSTELITPPAGLVTAKMPFTGSGASEDYADSVLVGWDKDTVYIQGLAVDFPTAWIKGVLKEGIVTFEKFQFVGNYSTMPIWVLGTNAEDELLDFTMTYDAQANLFKATNIFVVNASYEKIYYLDKVSKVVIGEVPQADWGEWEDFAPFGYNTGSWTFVAMATSPQVYTNYVALVRTDKNNADNKQIKITNWGEGWFGAGVELIINWNAKDNTCSIDKQFTGYVDAQYGNVYVASVEDGTYNSETGTFSIKVDYTVSAGSFGKGVETYVMDTKQPALMYDTDAPFNATFAWREMSASIEDGVIGIYATNADMQTIGLELYADPANTTIPAGTYVISDLFEAGTALQSAGVVGGSLTECWAGNRSATGGISDCWFMVEGTITLSYDEYGKLKVVVDAKNSYGQPVTALVKYEKLEPKSVVTIEADNMKFTGAGTMFLLDAANTNYEVALMVMSTDTAGTYGVEDLVATYSAIYSADGSQVSILDGEFTLALNGKDMTLTGWVLGSDTVKYNLNLTGKIGILSFDSDEDFEGEFNLENADIKTSEGMIMLSAKNEDNQVVSLVFFAALTEDATIPAGTYAINNSQEAGTVLASSGLTPVEQQMRLLPSYAGLSSDAGITAAWFMVSGTVVVAEDGSITINALNSYDRNITITIDNPATALYRINANAAIRKAMIKGQVVIFKNNKAYNLMGAEL